MNHGMQRNGYFAVWRKLWDNPRSRDPHWIAVWVYLISEATHAERPVVWNRKRRILLPGQFVTGRLKIAEVTGVNESKVKRLLSILKDEEQIEIETCNQNSLVTVLNWGNHQWTANDQPMTNASSSNPEGKGTIAPANDQPMDNAWTTENGKRRKNRTTGDQPMTSASGSDPEGKGTIAPANGQPKSGKQAKSGQPVTTNNKGDNNKIYTLSARAREGDLEALAGDIRKAKREFQVMHEMAIINELRLARDEGHDIVANTEQFLVDMENSVSLPPHPLPKLRHYLGFRKKTGGRNGCSGGIQKKDLAKPVMGDWGKGKK